MFCMLQTQIMFASFETEQRRVHGAAHSPYDVFFDAVNNAGITTNKITLKNKKQKIGHVDVKNIFGSFSAAHDARLSTRSSLLQYPLSTQHFVYMRLKVNV